MDKQLLCGDSRHGLSRDHQAVPHGVSGQVVRHGRGRFHPAPWNGAGLPAPSVKQLKEIAAQHSDVYTQITGKGLLIGQHFVNDDIGYAVASGLFKRGVLISGTLNNSRVIRVEPPLVITHEEIDTVLNRLEDTLRELHAFTSTPGVPAASEVTSTTKVVEASTAVA